MQIPVSDQLLFITQSSQIIQKLLADGLIPTVTLSINPNNPNHIHISNFPGTSDVVILKAVITAAFMAISLNPDTPVEQTKINTSTDN